MTFDLNSVGMKKGQQYETIITTENEKNEKNAAPIGVICQGKNEIKCRIFKGTTTSNNILLKKEFIVNITNNPMLFTMSTIDNIPNSYFIEDSKLAILKDSEAFLKCEVFDIKEGIKHNDPINKAEINIISANVSEIVINENCPKAANRSFYSLIESLVNFTRIDIVDSEKQNYFIDRFNESKRVINKVGSKEDKEAIKLLQKTLKEKGFDI